ncbi:MAG: hypothetical protein KGQ95_09115 [Acidobacteria bacterium]|nr:hypothetical protein [Acidobacteriota bacterium]
MPPKLLALIVAAPLAVGALAGCGGSEASDGASSSASTAAVRKAAGAGFSMTSEMPDSVPVSATQWGEGTEWVPLASPGNINGSKEYPNGIVLTAGQPVSVLIETKDGLERTFVLKILGERVTVKMQGPNCIGLWRQSATKSVIFTSSVQFPNARLTCVGSGFLLRPFPPPA